MTIRRDLINAASWARKTLGRSSDLVAIFLKEQLNDDGGFKGRSNQSDLYYTVFGIEALLAIGEQLPSERIENYLSTFRNLGSMDLVTLACLARCKADISGEKFSEPIADAIKEFRSKDGGFNNKPNAEKGTAYGCFLALGAYQDIGACAPDPQAIADSIDSLKTAEGAYVNDPAIPVGSTPATAAALSVLYYLDADIGADTADWLLKRVTPEGGFLAMEKAPVADLLSTATALHALSLVDADTANLQERCLDFVDTLWDGYGGFCGSIADRTCDCEYTFYGLLALGHLSG